MKKKYTRQDCIDSLRKAAFELGKSPSCSEYDNLGWSPGYRTIQERFNGWNTAKEAADLHTVLPKHERPVSFYTDERGYEQVATKTGNEQQMCAVHRLVAVAEYGLSSVVDKDVHHSNGVRWDNRPENLEPLSRSDHMKLESEKRKQANQQ